MLPTIPPAKIGRNGTCAPAIEVEVVASEVKAEVEVEVEVKED